VHRRSVSQMEQANGRSPSLCQRTLTCSHTAIRSPGLRCNGILLRDPRNSRNPWIIHVIHGLLLIYHPRGIAGWVGFVACPIADSLKNSVVTCQPQAQVSDSPPAKDQTATLPRSACEFLLVPYASSPTLAQEDCARLRLVRFLSVGRAPT